MRIIEHPYQPGTISFYNEKLKKRSYWFSANNLFDVIISKDEAVEIILHWTSEDVEKAAKPFVEHDQQWTSFQLNHEIVIL